MPNREHYAMLKQGAEHWNTWREQQKELHYPDLRRANLRGINLRGANLRGADLSRADLHYSDLRDADLSAGADLREADLSEADLTRANLCNTSLIEANLQGAKLNEATLCDANFFKANLSRTNLNEADLDGTDFSQANLRGATLCGATATRRAYFRNADLSGATLSRATIINANLDEAILDRAILDAANLRDADLSRATFIEANLQGADLSRAALVDANLGGADLSSAVLIEANLSGSMLIRTNLSSANLINCRMYGASVWKVQLEGTKQEKLVITDYGEPSITIDNINVAQFVYLMLNNKEIRGIIDTMTTKVILILGRFTEKQKPILDALRTAIPAYNLLPIMYDFQEPEARDRTETILLLASLARFIIADITDAEAVPVELVEIVRNFRSIPVKLILQAGSKGYSMMDHILGGGSPVLHPVYRYRDQDELLGSLLDKIITPAEQKFQEQVMDLEQIRKQWF